MRLEFKFNSGRNGFSYLDDAFRFTSHPSYASGSYDATHGYSSGALRVTLGGIDNSDRSGMSGGWSKNFTLTGVEHVTVTFRYKMTQSPSYDGDEYSDVLFALDGRLIGTGGTNRIARITGNGDGGSDRSTNWRIVTLDLGELDAGSHNVRFGGFNNQKTHSSERTVVLIDNVLVETTPRLGSFEARVLELTNDYRAAHGKAPLENDSRLNAAAEDWSRTMANGDFFGHSGPEQVRDHDYDPAAWGENIAAGYRSPESVVNGWINSPGHRANLLSDRYTDIGIGYYYRANDGGDARHGHYWTQEFGDPLLA